MTAKVTPREMFDLLRALDAAADTVSDLGQIYAKVIRDAGDHANGDPVTGQALLTAATCLIMDVQERVGRRLQVVMDELDAAGDETT